MVGVGGVGIILWWRVCFGGADGRVVVDVVDANGIEGPVVEWEHRNTYR